MATKHDTSKAWGGGQGGKCNEGGLGLSSEKIRCFFPPFFLCSYLEGESKVQAFSLVNLAFGGQHTTRVEDCVPGCSEGSGVF